MHAITFDLTTASDNAQSDIRKVLEPLGFAAQHDGLYFGNDTINAVHCVLAAQALNRAFPWFKASVLNFRMLRVEEVNSLHPALGPDPEMIDDESPELTDDFFKKG